jgi:nitrite reductase/ring-hydroxylating ferredoxin subunit
LSETATDPCFPERLQAWYRVCSTRELAAGRVLRWDLPGRPFVLWRGRHDGQVHAAAAHCAHMGTHLGFGAVAGDALRCPLHHWEWGGDGACRAVPGSPPAALRQRIFPVAETQGSVFVFNGPVPRSPPPSLSTDGTDGEAPARTLAGKPVRLRCSWAAVASNGFDMQHMQTVHGRDRRGEPQIERPDASTFRMRLGLRVTGRSLPDRVIQGLSRNHVRLTVTCFGGTVVAVESDLGRTRSGLLLCLRPVAAGSGGEGVEITPIFAVFPGPFAGLRVRAARLLYSGFIRKDVAFMDGMRFHPAAAGPSDPVLRSFLSYLRELPAEADVRESGGRAEERAAQGRRGGTG